MIPFKLKKRVEQMLVPRKIVELGPHPAAHHAVFCYVYDIDGTYMGIDWIGDKEDPHSIPAPFDHEKIKAIQSAR